MMHSDEYGMVTMTQWHYDALVEARSARRESRARLVRALRAAMRHLAFARRVSVARAEDYQRVCAELRRVRADWEQSLAQTDAPIAQLRAENERLRRELDGIDRLAYREVRGPVTLHPADRDLIDYGPRSRE